MKLKYKMILDLLMAITLFFIMKYDVTGGLIHEIIGFVLIVGFLIHIIWNRKYFNAVGKILKNSKNRSKNLLRFLLNILLIVCVPIMLVTSVLISKDLLYMINQNIGNYMIIRTVHVICAYIMVLSVVGHVILHLDMIVSFIRKGFQKSLSEKVCKNTSRVLAFVLAVFVFKASIENVAESINLLKSNYAYEKKYISDYVYNSGDSIVQETKESDSVKIEETIAATESTTQITQTESTKVSQEEYLSKLFCTGCPKHCSLLSPQCSKGKAQQSSAIAQYNAM